MNNINNGGNVKQSVRAKVDGGSDSHDALSASWNQSQGQCDTPHQRKEYSRDNNSANNNGMDTSVIDECDEEVDDFLPELQLARSASLNRAAQQGRSDRTQPQNTGFVLTRKLRGFSQRNLVQGLDSTVRPNMSRPGSMRFVEATMNGLKSTGSTTDLEDGQESSHPL